MRMSTYALHIQYIFIMRSTLTHAHRQAPAPTSARCSEPESQSHWGPPAGRPRAPGLCTPSHPRPWCWAGAPPWPAPGTGRTAWVHRPRSWREPGRWPAATGPGLPVWRAWWLASRRRKRGTHSGFISVLVSRVVGVEWVCVCSGGDAGYDVIINRIPRAHTFYKKYQVSHLNMESVDYDDTNINLLFVDPLFISLDEMCVLLRVYC